MKTADLVLDTALLMHKIVLRNSNQEIRCKIEKSEISDSCRPELRCIHRTANYNIMVHF